jgi:hypothetical protein
MLFIRVVLLTFVEIFCSRPLRISKNKRNSQFEDFTEEITATASRDKDLLSLKCRQRQKREVI